MKRTPLIGTVLALLSLLVGGLAGAAPSTASADRTAAPGSSTTTLWAGYRVAGDGHAFGGWIGGRTLQVGKHRYRAYRIDPTRSPAESTYGAPRVVRLWKGAHAPSKRAVQRAAWVLAKYGSYNGSSRDVQAAAVDATVDDLLTGGTYGLGGRAGSARIRQTHQARYIRAYTRVLVHDSAEYAGPYTTSLRASRVPVGSTSKVTFRLRSAVTGAGIPQVKVKLTYHGKTQRVVTDKSGKATAYVQAVEGAHPVRAAVPLLPDWNLWVASPRRGSSSRVAVADQRVTAHAQTSVVGVVAPRVRVTNDHGTLRTGDSMTGSYTVTGGSGLRQVTISVYGPQGASPVACSGQAARVTHTTISQAGTYPLPAYATESSGYYAYGVVVDANSASAGSSTCGPSVRAQSRATLSQDGPASVAVGDPFRIDVRVRGFDRTEAHTLTTRFYGPFANQGATTCSDDRLVGAKSVTKSVSSNGTYTMPPTTIGRRSEAGWYVYKTSLTNGVFIGGTSSSCGTPVHVTP